MAFCCDDDLLQNFDYWPRVFAAGVETQIRSVRDFYSVAVDNVSAEPRLVGDSRLVRYCRFLLEFYFPGHDDLCSEEGRLMKQYAAGTEEEKQEALAQLGLIHGRVRRNMHKYFGL